VELTGILRASEFSPFQHAENDRLILEKTAACLRRMGCRTRLISEGQVGSVPLDATAVFSMCQGYRANRILARMAAQGLLVVNSPVAVQRCYRENLYPFLGPGFPLVPRTELVRTDRPEGPGLDMVDAGPVWIKRGDVHATQADDVVLAHDRRQCEEVVAGFWRRGIAMAAVQEHLEGQVVKFYGVRGTSFFRYYTEGDPKICPVAFSQARQGIERLARTLGLDVYGGDAVIGADGRILVIDVNDWPSFACFRADAAEAIARRILQRAVGRLSRRRASTAPRAPLRQLQ
jgi:glutathione synthase/RimK-type ligase-like ATP-grasp enzyme